jgi:hypothetical protein
MTSKTNQRILPRKLLLLVFVLVIALLGLVFVTNVTVNAQNPGTGVLCPDGTRLPPGIPASECNTGPRDGYMFCPGTRIEVPIGTPCPDPPTRTDGFNERPYWSEGDLSGQIDCMGADLNEGSCRLIGRLNTFIMALSTLVGVVVVAMITLGGIQYSASRDNPQEAQAAKTRIRNALIALVVYIFAFAILQWLIPGGVF